MGLWIPAAFAVDPPPTPVWGTLQLSPTNYSVSEGAGYVTITATRTNGVDDLLTGYFSTSNGTALAGSDYTATNGALVWADKDGTSKTFRVYILNDAAFESNETFTVKWRWTYWWGDPAGSPSAATVTIVDDEPGTIQFSAATYSTTENGGTVTLTATRTNGYTGAASVNFGTAGNSATAGSDFTSTNGTFSWTNGEAASKTFTVVILNDAFHENPETFTATLSGATGASLGAPASATVTIVDDETPPGFVQLSATAYSGLENSGTVTLTATRTNGSYGAASVSYTTANGSATAGSDYTATNGTLSWANGDSASKTFSVPLLDDATYESNETFTVTLSGATGAALSAPASATVTIADNEPGVIQLTAAACSANESEGTVTLTATRTNGSYGAASVSYTTANGTAVAGLDYTSTNGTLSWADGDATSKTFSVTLLDDALYESNETFTVSLSDATGAALGTPATNTVTLADNEPGSLQFNVTTNSINENGETLTLTVTRTNGSYGAASVLFATSNGTAVAGSDYTSTNGTLVWADGDATSKTFTVSILNDATGETSETFSVVLSDATGAALGTPATNVVTIVDDEPGVIQFTAASCSVNESEGTVTLTATRTNGSYGAASVSYATANGSALAGSDYTATNGTLTWADGDATSKTFTVSILNDATGETSETFTVSLSDATGGILGAPAINTVTITDDEPGVIQFTASSYPANESDATVTLTATRTNGSTGAASVSYVTAGGTATADSDFASTNGTLDWADGDTTSKTFTVTLLDDALYESNETFSVSLSDATGATLGDPNSATVTIADNESGTLQFNVTTNSIIENGETLTLTVTRTNGSSGTASVSYTTSNGTALAGSDYTSTNGTLVWADGDATSKTFTVSILNDTTGETSETFTLILNNATGAALSAPASATVTIVDNETPHPGLVRWRAAYCSVNESNKMITLTAARTNGSDGAASVSYTTANGSALAGSDYTATNGMLSWTNGETASKTVTISILNDAIYEGNETFTVNLSGAAGAGLGIPAAATVKIVDDETPPPGLVRWRAAYCSVNESNRTLTIVAARTNGYYGAASVHFATTNGTATAGSDYTATNGTLSWTNGETASKTVTISILNDAIYEGNETFTVNLSGATGAGLGTPASVTVKIIDDETPPPGQLRFTASAYNAQEGVKCKVWVSRINGTNGTVSASFWLKPLTALAGKDYLAPPPTTLTWLNGDTSAKVIKITIPADTLVEGSESFQVILKNPVRATLVAPYKTTITIAANSKSATPLTATDATLSTLAAALNATDLTWHTSSLAPWVKQSYVVPDGEPAAARSGSTALQQTSWLQTDVTGPGTLAFDWMMKGSGAEAGLVMVDGQIQRTLGPDDIAWAHEALTLGDGAHTIRWIFVGNGSPTPGAAYLDRVDWSPAQR